MEQHRPCTAAGPVLLLHMGGCMLGLSCNLAPCQPHCLLCGCLSAVKGTRTWLRAAPRDQAGQGLLLQRVILFWCRSEPTRAENHLSAPFTGAGPGLAAAPAAREAGGEAGHAACSGTPVSVWCFHLLMHGSWSTSVSIGSGL